MNKKISDSDCFLVLSSNFSIGSKSIFKLKKTYKDMYRLWHNPKDIQKIVGKTVALEILKTIREINIEDYKNNLKKLGIKYSTYLQNNYPKILREIIDPPAVLYYKGELPESSELCLGVVGSRKFTNYGRCATRDIVAGLSRTGLVIISGLALGIDAIAHEEALKNKAKTIAILGCGLDMIYPASNIGLARKIIETGGAIISEYPPGVPPYKSNFVLRNRIIAGLSLGILVVEAAKKSGTLLTAKAALDYNREVFAVPGSIYSFTSEGSNNLIKYGAKPATSYMDILDNLNIENIASEKRMQAILPDNKYEKKILEAIYGSDGIHIDKLSKICDFSIDVIGSHLTLMEMKGKVKNLGGSIYIVNK